MAALDRLAEADRSAFVAREEGASTGELARRMGTSPGAVAVRLARARAKLRVDYVVALEHASLPSSRCRPVLLALSAHNRQAQAASGAGHHLLDCATCASLAPPLLERRRPVAFVVPALLGHRVWTWGRRRPLQAGAAIAVAIAVVVPLRGMTAGDERTTAPAPACPFSVSVEGRAVSLSDSAALRSRAGASVRGTGIPVLDVAADEGFWVGCGGSDVWVQLVGDGESSQEVGTGARVDFTGRIVAHAVGFGATVGNEGDAARRLDDQRLHIEVAYQDLSVN